MTKDAGTGTQPTSQPPSGSPCRPRHDPPWAASRRGPGRPPWTQKDWHPKGQRYSSHFRGFIFLMVLLFTGGMAIFAYLLTRLFGGDSSTVLIVWLSGCGLSLLIPLLMLVGAARAYRSYAVPLGDIMDAADAVADGNFDVQVEPRGSRDFRRLVDSFNRMTAELAHTNQQRRNLTADVAHELRTPLHIIQGNLEGVLDDIYEATPEHIETTLQETRTLARLVDDLSTLSLAESGELPLHREPVDIGDLLADAATSFGPQADSVGLELFVDTETIEPLTVYGDPGRLDQVLGNLIANAVRHTPAGGSITLSASRIQDRVRITIADTGEGIEAEDLLYIFDRFWRGDRSRNA